METQLTCGSKKYRTNGTVNVRDNNSQPRGLPVVHPYEPFTDFYVLPITL